MATCAQKYAHGSAEEHILTCEKHDLIIDMICEDCDEFICTRCAKTDHKEHDWNTIPTAGSLRRRELKKTLCKVTEEDVKEMDEKIKMVARRKENHQKCYDSEVSKLQNRYDAIVSKLDEIKKNYEKILKENLETKNAKVSKKKINFEKKSEKIKDYVKFLEEKHSTISDYSLIDSLRDLAILKSKKKCDLKKGNFSVRYRRGDIKKEQLESMMRPAFHLDDSTVTETNSFQYGDDIVAVMEAIDEDTCFVGGIKSSYINKVNNMNDDKITFNVNVNDVRATDNGDVYATDFENLSIVRLSPSDSVSTIFSTDPLVPGGICQSTDGGLMLTLRDNESEPYQLDSHSRRLVRHVTLIGDFIREYEFQEDGQTRLFTVPFRVKQNGNTDICVVNRTSKCDGELVILSASGSLKSVYRGKNQGFQFSDVACDTHYNIIVSDYSNSQIHLLSPDVEFIKYLLTKNEIRNPWSMSLYKSTLWVGNAHGLVKVFQYFNEI